MLTVMKNSVPKLIDFCLEMMYRNMVRALMCLELILNAVNINFVTFSDFFDSRQIKGNIFSIFVIAIAAAEAAIGPAIVSSIYRNRKSTHINQSNLLNK